jgi:hypothetical protein
MNVCFFGQNCSNPPNSYVLADFNSDGYANGGWGEELASYFFANNEECDLTFAGKFLVNGSCSDEIAFAFDIPLNDGGHLILHCTVYNDGSADYRTVHQPSTGGAHAGVGSGSQQTVDVSFGQTSCSIDPQTNSISYGAAMCDSNNQPLNLVATGRAFILMSGDGPCCDIEMYEFKFSRTVSTIGGLISLLQDIASLINSLSNEYASDIQALRKAITDAQTILGNNAPGGSTMDYYTGSTFSEFQAQVDYWYPSGTTDTTTNQRRAELLAITGNLQDAATNAFTNILTGIVENLSNPQIARWFGENFENAGAVSGSKIVGDEQPSSYEFAFYGPEPNMDACSGCEEGCETKLLSGCELETVDLQS